MKKLVICNHCEAIDRITINKSENGYFECGKCKKKIEEKAGPWPVTDQRLEKLISLSELPVVVDVYADWCGPCKMYAPIFKNVSARLWEKADFYKIDSESNPNISHRYNIRGIPMTLIFKNGQLVCSQSGAMDEVQLERLIQKYM